ncbi:kinase-like domain-containing protein [Blakeslea trispora]|nr:kinase-like domain-containing protein [Blakeslea trispora]
MVESKQKRCRIFDDRYKKIKILGKGNFGEVFLAEDFTTRKRVAIKVVDTKKFKNEDQKRHAENEKEICRLFSKRNFRHPHIVNVKDVSVENYCNYYVLEYVDGGELYERIKREGKIQESQAKVWFRQLVEAVDYIHKHGIVHRDLKPENVLLDKAGTIRLCDFGFGKIFDATQLLDTYCGSPFYAAPEMVTATPYRGPPVDMWSCGVILYAMLTGQLPFHCDTMPELFKKISMAEYMEPSTLSIEALDLIRSLLCRNPKRRMTAEGVLKHAWLKNNGMTKKKKRKRPT